MYTYLYTYMTYAVWLLQVGAASEACINEKGIFITPCLAWLLFRGQAGQSGDVWLRQSILIKYKGKWNAGPRAYNPIKATWQRSGAPI